MIGQAAVMGVEGHIKLEWDTDDPASVTQAKDEFKKLLGKGYTLWRTDRDPHEQVKRFNQEIGEYLVVGPMAGG